MNDRKFVEIEEKLIGSFLDNIKQETPLYPYLSEGKKINNLLPAEAAKMPALWELILFLGHNAPSQVRLEHVLSLDDEEMTKQMGDDPYYRALIQSGELRLFATAYCEMIETIPGALYFTRETSDEASDRQREQLFFNFVLSSAGANLFEAIVYARQEGTLESFLHSFDNEYFIHVLCEVALNALSLKPRDWLIKEKAKAIADEDDLQFNLFTEVQHRATRQEEAALSKNLENLRKSKSRKKKHIPSASELIRSRWLSMVLWNKTTAEILDALPTLKSGDDANAHEADCKKIDSAIRRLSLTRYKPG